MKSRIYLIIFLASVTFHVQAQNEPSYYLNKAMEKLDAGDCESAGRSYQVYLDISGGVKVPSVERSISECENAIVKEEAMLQNIFNKILEGNCRTARILYDQYKAKYQKSDSNIEAAISKCEKEQNNQAQSATTTTQPASSQSQVTSRSKTNLYNNSYCNRRKNDYVAWGIVGTGYPWNLVSSVEFRIGSVVGFGGYLDLGMDFTHVDVDVKSYERTYTNYGSTTKVNFRYAGGLKFFLYRGLYLDLGYGTIANPTTTVTLNGSDDWKKRALNQVQTSHGFLFHVGYNLVTDLSSNAGFFLGLNGGASYDMVNKVFSPSVNLKIGVAWNYDR